MKTVGVFFGSRSAEHDISIITGQLIISTLKKMNYTAIPIYIDKKGGWFIGPELGSLKTFTGETFNLLSKKLGEYYLDLEKSSGKMVFKQKGVLGKEVIVELAFPALHGTYGEDGTLQGLFEMINIPYVGCNVMSSAIAMDKVLTKQVFMANNIPTLSFVSHTKQDWLHDKDRVVTEVKHALTWPVIIKPAHLGSSIGISIAKNEEELENALEVGFHYDEKVLTEQCVKDLSDITCALLGNENPKASLLQESTYEKDLFSYEDKYLNDGGAQLGNAKKNLHIPARLDDKTTIEIRETAVKIYKAFECSGIARVDFIYDKKAKKYYASEINPLPGTLYHHLWKDSGVELEEVISTLLTLAQERHKDKQLVTYTFQSDILKHAGSIKLQLKK